MNKSGYRIEYLYRPGLKRSESDLKHLVKEIREAASTCFDDLPGYQAMAGSREEMSDKVIALAWRPDGKIAGFCSMVVLPVPGVGDVLHTGLTCVRPEDRSSGLTHVLASRATVQYLARQSPVGRVWVSNVACVLSSLGNVAMHFDNVYPSPYLKRGPGAVHFMIARAIDEHYRDKIFISPEAEFDYENFVFRRSVEGTVFQKDREDSRYHHRDKVLNDYYASLMDFGRGDEVLQVASVSLLTIMRHARSRGKAAKGKTARLIGRGKARRVA